MRALICRELQRGVVADLPVEKVVRLERGRVGAGGDEQPAAVIQTEDDGIVARGYSVNADTRPRLARALKRDRIGKFQPLPPLGKKPLNSQVSKSCEV